MRNKVNCVKYYETDEVVNTRNNYKIFSIDKCERHKTLINRFLILSYVVCIHNRVPNREKKLQRIVV
jgi:hypothetical protein